LDIERIKAIEKVNAKDHKKHSANALTLSPGMLRFSPEATGT